MTTAGQKRRKVSVFAEKLENRVNDAKKNTYFGHLMDVFEEEFDMTVSTEQLRNYRRSHRVYLSLILRFLILLIFALFLWDGYGKAKNEQFLSLSNNAGNCQQEPRTLAGVYYIDTNGYWSGRTNYNPSEAMFSVELSNFAHDFDSYQKFTTLIADNMDMIAATSIYRNLAGNLLYWMNWAGVIDDEGNKHRVEMTGTPLRVFDRKDHFAAIGNEQSECSVAYDSIGFNNIDGAMTVYYNVEQYTDAEDCTSKAEASAFGYNDRSRETTFSIEWDIRSLTVAAAVNDGNLVEVRSGINALIFSVGGYDYQLGMRTDSRYPGMDAIYCVEALDNAAPLQHMCLVVVAAVLGLPYFNHYGYAGDLGTSMYEPHECICSGDALDASTCHRFNFMEGFVFFNTTSPMDAVPKLIETSINLKTLNTNIHSAVYNASFAALNLGSGKSTALLGQFPPNSPNGKAVRRMLNPAWRERAYEFCNGQCSVFAVNSFDNLDTAINMAHHQIVEGSCKDTFSPDTSVIERLKMDEENVPSTLVESYYTCKYNFKDTMLTAVGIASGNTSVLLPITIGFVLVSAAMFCGVKKKRPDSGGYTGEQKEKALDEWAIRLLATRDNKVHVEMPIPMLRELIKELHVLDTAERQGLFGPPSGKLDHKVYIATEDTPADGTCSVVEVRPQKHMTDESPV